MPDNSRSDPTPEQIKNLLQEALLRNYPNPERRGCSDQQVLNAVPARTLPHEAPAWEHITHCSPCYQEFLAYRASFLEHRRNKRRMFAAAGAIAAVALIAIVWLSTPR